MKDKFLMMWSDFDTSISWGTKKTRLPAWSIVIMSGLQKCIYMIICFGAFRALKMKKMPQAVSFFLILMIGYVLAHQLIEIQTRYRYFIMPIFMLLAGSGLEQVDCHKKKKNVS